MTTWLERIRPIIKLTSPNGSEFEAKWRGNTRRRDNKMAMFDFPGIVGTVVQNLGFRSWLWPMTIFFDGVDNDKEAFRFATATGETGQWGVIHPIYGFKGLDMISVAERNLPIEEGGYTAFELEFIESIDPLTLKTAAEMSDQIGFQSDLVNVSAADQFLANIRNQSATDTWSIGAAVDKITGPINQILGPISEASDAVFETQNQIQRGLQDILNAAVLQPLSLAGQIQQLVQNPLRAITDIKTRLNAYGDLAGELFGLTPSETDNKSRNQAAVQELTMTSIVVSNAKIANTKPSRTGIPSVGGLNSRKVVNDTANQIGQSHVAINDNLEETQVVFEDVPIENQWVSQKETHYQTAQITGLAISYLISSSFDLRIERRFTLDRPRIPVMLAMELYNGPGEADENIDLFLESNDLHGLDILRLPAGREVIYYA
jgi:hypothetical protein